MLVAFVLWKRHIGNRPCVVYIDNNSTRDVSISGTARTYPGSALVGQLLEIEDRWGVLAWYSRVPSSSNIADGPSRGSCSGLSVKPLPVTLVSLAVQKCLSKLVNESAQ